MVMNCRFVKIRNTKRYWLVIQERKVAAVSSLWKTNMVNAVKRHIKWEPSPTLQMFRRKLSLTRGLRFMSCIKRKPLFHLPGKGGSQVGEVLYDKYSFSGSMTVEAAVIIPMFLFFFVNLMSAIEMIRLHSRLELALWENGRIMAVSGYAYDRIFGEEGDKVSADAKWDEVILEIGTAFLSDFALYNAVTDDVGEDYLKESPLTYGKKGLVFLESTIGEDDCIDVKVTYQVSPVFRIPAFTSFRMTNRYYARAWTGYPVNSEEGDGEEINSVYVTPYGEVYHVRRDCSYLMRNISAVTLSEVYNARNDNGERYVLCLICGGSGQEIVYLTPDGSRYHERLDCSGLKRTIITVKRVTAQAKYRPCSKCAL